MSPLGARRCLPGVHVVVRGARRCPAVHVVVQSSRHCQVLMHVIGSVAPSNTEIGVQWAGVGRNLENICF